MRIGGSKVVILPAVLCKLIGIMDGTQMELDIEKDSSGVVIILRKAGSK